LEFLVLVDERDEQEGCDMTGEGCLLRQLLSFREALSSSVDRAVADKRTEAEGEREENDDEFSELAPPTLKVESGSLFCPLDVEYGLELDFVMIKK
jgi:hypothetical protein